MPAPAPLRLSLNGLDFTLDQVARFAPVVRLHPAERNFPCTIEHLLAGARLLHNPDERTVLDNPAPDDLFTHFTDDYRVAISPDRFGGQPLASDGSVAAPMYVSAQVPDDRSFVDLNFQFLFAYNGSQCTRVLIPGQDFNCTLETFAEHQGDIEGMSIRVDPTFQRVLFVRCEAHGDSTFFHPDQVDFEGTHPLVCCALHSHASYNGLGRNPAADDWFPLETYSALGFGVAFVDIIRRDGIPWRPFEQDSSGSAVAGDRLRFIGLDRAGEPVGAERWAKFRGRLGRHERQKHTGQSGIEVPLTRDQNNFVGQLTDAVVALGVLPDSLSWGDGPGGFGSRDLINTEKPVWKFPAA